MRTATILQGRHGRPSALRAFVPALCVALLMAVIAAPASAAKLGPSLTSKLKASRRAACRTTVPSLAATVDPNGSVTRSDLAFALDHYRQAFAAGN